MENTTDPGVCPSVLIVDDEPDLLMVLEQGLRRHGFRVAQATSGAEALEMLAQSRYDVLVTDVHMPRMRGEDLQRIARERHPDLTVLLLTAAHDVALAVDCLKEGVADYITKPFDLRDVTMRIQRALERHRLIQENRLYQAQLEVRVAEQAERIRLMFQNSLQALNRALEAKDHYTRHHSRRVTALARLLVDHLHPDDPTFRNQVSVAAQFHDIGKIGVHETVLNKKGPLTREEFDEIKKHPVIGETILRPLFTDPEMLAIVRHHHESWDGSGYPDGRRGQRIPLGARIIAVADAYDAMTTLRSYREEMLPARALGILQERAGIQWDAEIVAAFVELARIGEVNRALQESEAAEPEDLSQNPIGTPEAGEAPRNPVSLAA